MALLVFLPDKQIATNLLRSRGIPSRGAIGLLAEPGMSGCNGPVHRLAKLRGGKKNVLLADEREHARLGKLAADGRVYSDQQQLAVTAL